MVRHQKGHKNSKGELAEWVIVSHKDGHIISSHKTKPEAEKHLNDIRKFKHMGESMDVLEAKELLESAGYRVIKEKELDEDFTMGVGELGADQGIPHSMQGCAVPMMRFGEPAPMGKIQKCCPPHPMHHHRPIPFGLWPVAVITTTSTKKRKKKKKKRKSKKKK